MKILIIPVCETLRGIDDLSFDCKRLVCALVLQANKEHIPVLATCLPFVFVYAVFRVQGVPNGGMEESLDIVLE